MPSPHRRIGLVVDADVDAALGAVRRGSDRDHLRDAAAVRDAVYDGAVLGALRAAARGPGGDATAVDLLARLRELLPTLELPPCVAATVAASLATDDARREGFRRRAAQLALISSPDPHGSAVLALLDDHDAEETSGTP